ncbi:DUF4333 domain-containing protein [Allokutzneria albata]|uniref:DUF4333 domain-containing protein n=1 Tax=Allokutzneria albata TaxID=211114 RepID=A0A1G9V786_ALLAB|nr:DUF4333 domain-containing protein [Allokutzneria albata]SDM67926.1 protein of unknown function [Allokutzneria albata]
MTTPQGPYPPQQPGQFPRQGPPTGPQPGFGPGPGGPRPPQGPPPGQFPQQHPGHPGQPGGGWGGASQAPAPAKEKKSKKGMFIGIGAVVVLAGAAVALYFMGFFTTNVFDDNALKNGVKGVLTKDFGVAEAKIGAIDCGTRNKIAAGSQFQCKVTIDGKQKISTIKVDNDQGLYTVGQPK